MQLRRAHLWTCWALAAVLVACATWSPMRFVPGTPLATVRQEMGLPTGEFSLPGGLRQLEYATGPFGKSTHLFRFDAAGHLLGVQQVLTEAQFALIHAGMTADEVRLRLGRPSTTFGVMRPPETVWAYRYEVTWCQWFMVGVGADGHVIDTAYGPDPVCDVREAGSAP